MNKTLKAGWANWPTTLIGAILAGLIVMDEGEIDPGNPKTWIAVAIAVLGFLTRTASFSSQDSGVR